MFGDLLNAAIRTITLPIQVVKDIVDVASGDEPKNTKKTLEDIHDDIFGG